MSIYKFSVETISGDRIILKAFKGQVLLIVNTASKCGFTPQYKELQQLYEAYHEKGFNILAFPSNQFGNQEPYRNEVIEQFCQQNYQVQFPLFSKVNVKGKKAHPLFHYLTKEAPGIFGSKSIKWNFTKFLLDRNGQVVNRFAPTVKPLQLKKEIERLL
ncbi:glutathione peroxidase [Bacillus aquiflavi]|uniref:glutathione peroxidase n=1 Tax=Bacillus aquiflavi TaxID=2672567 RepID=UPI001CA8A10C|nr:glutathione peroxidase [Bacillus aquiflavi]UAC46978.1 glutathione peroxidase [Bacillus aquiflavi]